MRILDTIVKHKRREIELRKSVIPRNQLEGHHLFDRSTLSLSQALKRSESGIIAEFKRRSPSKSVINQSSTVDGVARGYEKAGVCGMSVLTDGTFFGGSLDDLISARASCELPLLRKDFILDPYQIIEAKAHGADVILLIAAILNPSEFAELNNIARSLHLEVLAEVHNETELRTIMDVEVDMIGVNNRDLKTFDVSVDTSKQLSTLIPESVVKVSESGLKSVRLIKELREFGYRGFLIGETFMRSSEPGVHARTMINEIENET